MANSNIRGLVPVKHINGLNCFNTVTRPTRGDNLRNIFPGDVVRLDASAGSENGVQPYHDAASGGNSRLPLGVVARVLNADGRPFTFNQPGAGPIIPASSNGFVEIYEDPGIIYRANTSATATYANVGAFAAIRVCAATTAVGRSGMSVDIGTVVTAAGQVMKMFNMVTEGETDGEVRVSGEANNDVEVIFVNTAWTNPWFKNDTGVPASGNAA